MQISCRIVGTKPIDLTVLKNGYIPCIPTTMCTPLWQSVGCWPLQVLPPAHHRKCKWRKEDRSTPQLSQYLFFLLIHFYWVLKNLYKTHTNNKEKKNMADTTEWVISVNTHHSNSIWITQQYVKQINRISHISKTVTACCSYRVSETKKKTGFSASSVVAHTYSHSHEPT